MTDKINETSEVTEEENTLTENEENTVKNEAVQPSVPEEAEAGEKTEKNEGDDSADNTAPSTTDTAEKRPSPITSLFEWLEMFAVYFAVGIAVLMLFFRHCPVNGDSMEHTLKNNDMLILRTFNYTPENGDMIVCQSQSYGLDKPLVKRVIAKGGQTVKIDYENWTVTVDGVTLDEDYIWKREGRPMLKVDLPSEFTVPEGYIFVMGDNRNASKDSRDKDIGFIDERYVVGKVSARILPLSDFTIFE